jgi:hypothetical protein
MVYNMIYTIFLFCIYHGIYLRWPGIYHFWGGIYHEATFRVQMYPDRDRTAVPPSLRLQSVFTGHVILITVT